MIVFLGDSFTWGQGLYSKKWIQEGKSIQYCENHLPPGFSHENISYSDDEYRRKYHFPNLVAKHYDRSYYVKPKNGGTNEDIEDMIERIYSYAHDDAVDFVVVQFTEFMRSTRYSIPPEYQNFDIDEFVQMECKRQVDSIYNLLIKHDVKNFVFFSWREDIGRIIKRDYFNNYVPLIYKNIEYVCFADMIDAHRELDLMGDIGVADGHFSELAHEVVADSIIKKVDTMNIDFIRPRNITLV